MPTLTELSADLLELLDAFTDADGCDPEYQSAVEQALSDAGDQFDSKVDGYASLIRELELRSKAQKEEAERLLTKAKTAEGSAAWLKKTLLEAMDRTGRRRVETSRFKVSVARNSSAPVVLHVDPDLVPDAWSRVTRKPDMTSIRKALKNGADLPFARLGEPGTHLRIS